MFEMTKMEKDMGNNEKLQHLRHTAAHALAAAVLRLYPGTHNAIGPSIEEGFYQDFDMGDHKISENDLPKIEEEMRKIVKNWHHFEVKEVTPDEARSAFKHNPYKSQLIEEFAKEGKTITLNNPGDFLDLCKGGHSDNPAEDLKYFKLMKLAGAYWRGDEKNKMLTRIYGTAFFTKEQLEGYLTMLEEAEKRDHKKLGKELDLFIFSETSPGMPYWLPKGLIVYNELLNFSRQIHKQFGYQEIMTPIMSKKELYETSGHWFHYRDDMFIAPMSFLRKENKDPFEGTEVFGIKPMNCPNAMTIFASKTRSYRDLPMRLSETTALHRFELSGTLNGLFRAREFHQDDSHTFVAISQIGEEFGKIMEMIAIFYGAFNVQYKLRFGTRPENFMGEAKDWDIAEKELQAVLDTSGAEYFEAAGEGAFYGPKVDILMKDSLGREWQTGTIQLDFQQPKNFKLTYIDNEGKEMRPATIHKAIYGSFERFLGILIENFEGKLPTWLAPVQVVLLPIADRHNEYAQTVADTLTGADIRIELDSSPERLQAKIRNATLQKIPFMGIIGDKEIEQNALSVRKQNGEDKGLVSLDQFLALLKGEIEKKIV